MMINKKVLQSSIITDRRTASQDNKIIPNLNYFTMELSNRCVYLTYNFCCSTIAVL